MPNNKRPIVIKIIGWAWIIIGAFMFLLFSFGLTVYLIVGGGPEIPPEYQMGTSFTYKHFLLITII